MREARQPRGRRIEGVRVLVLRIAEHVTVQGEAAPHTPCRTALSEVRGEQCGRSGRGHGQAGVVEAAVRRRVDLPATRIGGDGDCRGCLGWGGCAGGSRVCECAERQRIVADDAVDRHPDPQCGTDARGDTGAQTGEGSGADPDDDRIRHEALRAAFGQHLCERRTDELDVAPGGELGPVGDEPLAVDQCDGGRRRGVDRHDDHGASSVLGSLVGVLVRSLRRSLFG